MTVTLEVGQVWKTRNGKFVTITKVTPSRIYPFIGDNLESYTFDGHVDHEATNPEDLWELVGNNGLPVQPVTQDTDQDIDELASETLIGLGWHFNGQTWVQDNEIESDDEVELHPLYPVLTDAIRQAMYGKGKRHGGNATPFLNQPWVHYHAIHGRGFLTGQSAKKLEEAAMGKDGEDFVREVLGAIVYAGMSVLAERGDLK